ncbi:MAG: hypothetical protein B9S33_14970 [Pedosphaera sp. Tous-C6FEB]|nr:MAG: hypothetical protein B9S33_14970 [Pedosphaera sp. Tous-C6FEB]
MPAPAQPPRPSAFGFLRSTGACLRAHRGVAALILLCCMVEVSFTTGLPMCFAFLVDKVLVGNSDHLLGPMLAGMGVAVVGSALIGFGRAYLVAKVIVTMVAKLRERLFAHLQQLPLGFYQRTPQGEIVTRFSGNLKDVERTMEGCVPWVLIPGLEMLVTVTLLFLLDWRLALLAMLVFPASVMGPRFFSPRVARASEECKAAEGRVLTAVQENLGAQPVVKGFSLEPLARAGFATRSREQSAVGLRLAFAGAMLERTASVGTYILQVAVLGGGVWLAYQKQITIGQLGAFQTLFMGLCFSVSYIIQFVPRMVDASTSFQHVNALLAEPLKVTDAPGAAPLPPFTRALEFRDVSFSYTGEVLNLRNVSVAIPAGSTVAFVGTSGSGKSTMLNLAMRFYEASSGGVCYDDVDVKSAQLKSLRDQCGIVFQESFLFNESVRQNIRYGRLNATDEEIVAAARAAEIHDLILTLPQGYDTLVGERGGRLSGGQRQRVAIARALLRNPGILVLDEATSALDPGTEAALNRTLEQAGRGRTVLSVTHRLEAIENYSLILVFDKGVLVEQGRHADLVARQGLYARLVRKQTGLHVSADGSAAIDPEKLRELPVLQKVPDAMLAELAALFTTHTVETGREVFREGDPADNFYLIVRGRVEACKRVGETETRLRVMETGDAFGEIALLTETPRTATIRALAATTLLVLTREHFQRLFSRSRELRIALGEMADARARTENTAETASRFMLGVASELEAAKPEAPALPEQLHGLPLLHHLPPELRMEAAEMFTALELPAGQLIFREGQPADAFYLIVSGQVAVSRNFPEGARTLGSMGPGAAFGEIALLEDSPRTATLRTAQPTTLLRLPREQFAQLIERAPAFHQELRHLAAQRRGKA